MVVAPGYKQTEVGVTPEDWEVDSLSCYWNVIDCKHITAHFVNTGCPVASIGEVQGRFVNLTNAKQTTSQFYTLLTEGGRKPRTGDIILSRNATVGEAAQVAEWHPPFAMGQDVCLLRKKNLSFSSDYLQSVFRSTIIAHQLSGLMVGSTFKRVNVQQIKALVVPIPPPVEQHAIAAILSDADALIESLEQLIAKKRVVKQGAMQELLTGRWRLPGFEGQWEVKRLDELADIDPEQLSSATKSDYSFNYISLEDVNIGFLRGYTSYVFGSAPSRARRILRYNDVLVSTVRPNLKSHLWFREESMNWVCSTGFTVLQCRDKVAHPGYIFAHLFADGITKQIEALLTGSNYPTINSRDVRLLKIVAPSLPEQTAIAAVLSDMDAEIVPLEAKLDKARQVKQGMMQKLLTGRMRLV